jgi:hypothetical protein
VTEKSRNCLGKTKCPEDMRSGLAARSGQAQIGEWCVVCVGCVVCMVHSV